ncbi:type II secretion system F family protein [Geomonas sp. Red32]|uniref:type II secretion system F family protein n=1 Tax=Geomonas sp. Red32 TaxID=2912856 RepID=UPI00202CB5EF|nr:type II secretion system F family protein [Geomonas sp. Red32]MCM0083894.1 type II secretion system F family protein [Geomonas sp. Red32]
MLALIVLSVFGSVALISGAALYPLLSREDLLRGRVAKLMPHDKEGPVLIAAPTGWQTLLGRIGSLRQLNPTEIRRYREIVTAAGFRKEAVYVFVGAKLLCAVLLPAGYLLLPAGHLLFSAAPRGATSGGLTLLITICAAIGGYLLPTAWLSHLAETRKTTIFHALPDVLDLLTVCVEAGISLDAALIKTTDNFQHKNCPLIDELNRVILEIRAGRERSEALKGLAERTAVDDIRSLVAMLVQTERFGTSLGKTLRAFADSLRIKRRQIAEEKAAKTAVKMLFPLTFFVFPAMMVVMLVPAFVQIYAMFKK